MSETVKINGPMSHVLTELRKYDIDPNEVVTYRTSYEVDRLFSWGTFRDLLAAGRGQLDLVITEYPGGGWWIRRGHIKVEGPWRNVEIFMRATQKLSRQIS